MYRLFGIFLAVVSSLLIAPLALTSCSTVESSPSLTLDFPVGYSAASGVSPSRAFDEEDSFVVRCTSFAESERGITVTASKAKDAKASALVFIKSTETISSGAGVQIACAPITGKEYEYDMTQAKYYEISSASAAEVITAYGIYYSDWQAGAASDSAKFPCCE